MIAFASNSIFCRLALASDAIAPDTFTAVRLFSGMLMLLPIILFENKLTGKLLKLHNSEHKLLTFNLYNLWQPLMLFGYAIFFSLAYVQLDTGVGALILFSNGSDRDDVILSFSGEPGHSIRNTWLYNIVGRVGLSFISRSYRTTIERNYIDGVIRNLLGGLFAFGTKS